MKKAAVLLKEGYEETEALLSADILRRAGIRCDLISMEETKTVISSHHFRVEADRMFADNLDDYDMIICPGGLPGATNLQSDQRVLNLIRKFDEDPNKWVAAICAAPIVLASAGILKGKKATCYPSEEFIEQLKNAGADFQEEIVVKDGHIITSRGPATAFAFGYALVEALGKNSESLKKSMCYEMMKSSRL